MGPVSSPPFPLVKHCLPIETIPELYFMHRKISQVSNMMQFDHHAITKIKAVIMCTHAHFTCKHILSFLLVIFAFKVLTKSVPSLVWWFEGCLPNYPFG